MELKYFALIIVVLFSMSVKSEFFEDPKPCKYADTECIKEVINFLLKEKFEGEPSLNLRKIEPLKIGDVHLQHDEGSPVNIDLKLINSHIHGFKTARAVKVKGFDRDMTKKHRLILHADRLSTVGDYTIDGKILILPIKGDGKSNITMVDVTLKMDFVGVPYVKDGATYMKIEKFDLDAEPTGMIYKVDNLFNGDKALGDNMNLFLNENWKEIYQEVRASLSIAYGNIFKQVINEVLSKHPYEQFFKE